MKQKSMATRGLRRVLLVASLAAGFGLSAGTALAADGINPHADEILRAMSDHLGNTRSFTVEADISNEVMTVDGQKLQLNSYATVALDRPSRFKIARQGKFADVALFYDGTQMTLLGKELNAYMQKPLAGTIDDALRVVTLPPSCTTVIVENTTLHLCGGTYYQPYGTQYVVVNVQ